MVQKVTQYIAKDGSRFDTEGEALLHEATYLRTESIRNGLYQCTALSHEECRQVVEFMLQHYDITVKE